MPCTTFQIIRAKSANSQQVGCHTEVSENRKIGASVS